MVLTFVLSQCFNIKLISRATIQTCKVVRDTSQSREHSKMDRHFFRGWGWVISKKKLLNSKICWKIHGGRGRTGNKICKMLIFNVTKITAQVITLFVKSILKSLVSCNVIGSQRCDLFTNRTIYCSKSHLFLSQ